LIVPKINPTFDGGLTLFVGNKIFFYEETKRLHAAK